MFRALIIAAALAAAFPLRAEPSPMADAGVLWASPRPASGLGAIALRYEGATASRFGFRGAWCGFFIEYVRKQAGLSLAGSGRAIDQTRAGRRVSAPVPGALVITPRNRRGDFHVDIVLERHPDGTLTVIGGNVSKRVTKRRVAARGIYVVPM